jgi:hypothetical protein
VGKQYTALGAAVVVSIPFLVGCAHQAGQLGAAAYEQPAYGYKVAYRDPVAKSFADGDWGLDNYFVDNKGKWQAKSGDAYEAEREFDIDGDGEIGPRETSKSTSTICV